MWQTIKSIDFGGGRAQRSIIMRGDIQARAGILREISTSGKWVQGSGVGKGCVAGKT